MSNISEIDKAMSAHGMWKQRLRSAIETGNSDFKVEKVTLDNFCDFGKWLYSLDTKIKLTENWKTIHKYHAEFHKVAANVLDLALKGKKEEAFQAISLQSEFSAISGKLTNAMMRWKKELA